jgi:predicted nucleic acid-binding protein
MLVDSSFWIAYLRGQDSAAPLRDLIESGADIYVTEPIIMEVLAGARQASDYAKLRRFLVSQQLAPFDPAADFEGAARVYLTARAHGITPVGQVDCMIVAAAARTVMPLLTLDAQQRRIADLVDVV